jgi:RNA polymerase sigma-70 factor (ECF subfamily)
MPLDRCQFRELFDAERDRAHRFLTRLCGDPHEADDLLQEAFLRLWNHRDAFEGRGPAAAWLMKTSFRVYLSAREKRRRRLRLVPAAPAPQEALAQAPAPADALAFEEGEQRAHLLARVRRALEQLEDEPREAFVMFRLEGLSVAKIAELTDLPPKTVETRIRRATTLLAQLLGASAANPVGPRR